MAERLLLVLLLVYTRPAGLPRYRASSGRTLTAAVEWWRADPLAGLVSARAGLVSARAGLVSARAGLVSARAGLRDGWAAWPGAGA